MSSRLDRALDLFERLVVAVETIAERDVKPENVPQPTVVDTIPAPVRRNRSPDVVSTVERALRRKGIRR